MMQRAGREEMDQGKGTEKVGGTWVHKTMILALHVTYERITAYD